MLNVAAVGVPDPIRTEIVKAFVVLRPEFKCDDKVCRAAAGSVSPRRCTVMQSEQAARLKRDIADFVKQRLAAHEYPREVPALASQLARVAILPLPLCPQVEFVESLPMTATGKVMRKELKRTHIERAKAAQNNS